MQTLKALALLWILVIGVRMPFAQDVQIKSGNFSIQCKVSEEVRSNPDFLALWETVLADLKSAAESNQIALLKNIEVHGDIIKSSSSGKILNGVMVKVGNPGTEPATFRGTFFPCKDVSQSVEEYRQKIFGDYLKILIDRIKNFK